MTAPGALPRPSTLQLAIDADHVALLESTIREISARYCSADADRPTCIAWEQALADARKREADRTKRRGRFA